MGFQCGDIPAVTGRTKDTQEFNLPLNVEIYYSPVGYIFEISCQKKHYHIWT